MSEEKTQIRVAENEVMVEGLLLEKEVREGKTAENKEFLSVKLTIETAPKEQHQVELFAMKLKADGTENGIYTSLRTVADDYKTVAEVGRENADYVRTNTGEIRLNDYVGQDGQLRSNPQISATFINRVEAGEERNPKAKFDVELVVDRVIDEIINDEETGRVKLFGYIPIYGGKVIPFEFVVNEDGSPYVSDNYSKGDTVSVYGDIINKKDKIVTKTESAFGADKEKVVYNTIREFRISGGTEVYEEENVNSYDPELIRKALSEREVFLEGLKKKHEEKKKNSKKKGGFDTTVKKDKKSNDVNSDILPF